MKGAVMGSCKEGEARDEGVGQAESRNKGKPGQEVGNEKQPWTRRLR